MRWLTMLMLMSCASAGVTLRVDRAAYRPGEEAVLTLKNGTGNPAAYNLCTAGLVLAPASPLEEDRMCTQELRILAPGDEVSTPRTIPATAAAGTYRFTTRVVVQDVAIDVSSASFSIAP